jgi:hypothetical protein
MTASENSVIGLARQTAKGTPNVTDASFTYFLFTQGGGGVNNVVIPLDQEVGGGALLRNVVKVGVTSGGQYQIIPRVDSIGHFLAAALGAAGVAGAGPEYTHTFTLAADQFTAPYYTIRQSPGMLFGEQLQDCRINAFALNWRSPDFIRGAVGIMGGLPAIVSTAAWAPSTYLDRTAQFLTPVSTFEVPTATAIKVLSGSVVFGLNIPLDEQWIAGSYSPDAFDINSRSITVQLVVKIEDATLYKKMAYDPAAGSAWLVDTLREANFLIRFRSDQLADTATPHSLVIAGNGSTGADANVVWSVSPIAMAAGRQLTAVITGTFLASPVVAEPITVTLINKHVADYIP